MDNDTPTPSANATQTPVAAENGTILSTSHAHSGRFAVNLVTNLGNFTINILIGLWFVPYLVHHLGVSAYGLVPLTTQAVCYLSVLTLALNSSVGRYLTISLEHDDKREANRVFNTSVFGSLALACILLIPGLLSVFYIDRLFVIPAKHLGSAQWLMLCTIASFLIGTIFSPFDVSTFCKNRFDLRNIVAIVATSMRILPVIILFRIYKPSLEYVGTGILISALVAAAGSLLLCRKLIPALRVSIRDFKRDTLKNLITTGGWIVINQLGSLLYLSIDLVIANRMLGPKDAGHYAAVLQWSALLRALASTVAGVFSPTMLYLFAKGDMAGLTSYSKKAIRFSGLLCALPTGLICGLSRPLLKVWLGPEFATLAPLMTLMVVHLGINVSVFPLFSIQIATNKVKWPGIVTCVMGIANLCLAIVLTGPVGWRMYGIAAAGAIMLTAKNATFTPLYSAHIIGIKKSTFAKESWSIAMMTLLTALASWLMANMLNLESFHKLAGVGILIAIGYVILTYAFVLTSEERVTLRGMFAKWQAILRCHGEMS